jgi:tRNA nucleotidyltransferase (CCA-adding enzyme)
MESRVLRTVGRAQERFGEDGLRVLRAARFVATLEFDLEAQTEAAIPEALQSFARVSPERVRDEWMRTFGATTPSRGFQVMLRTGILGVTCPELVEQAGCEQNHHHAYDVWMHSLQCMDACARGPEHRLAGLLHDLGKPRTRALSDKTGDYTFYNHELVGAKMAATWLKRYRFSNEQRERVTHLVRHHLVCYSDEWSDSAVRRFIKRVGPGAVDDLLDLARADALAKGRDVEAELAALQQLRARIEAEHGAGAVFGTRDLAIDGRDVMHRLACAPGPIIGKVLEALLERVLDAPEINQRDTLLDLVEEVAAAVGSKSTEPS